MSHLRAFIGESHASMSEWLGAQGIALPLRLSLLGILLAPIGDWIVRPMILLVAVAGLLSERVLRSRGTWWLLVALTSWRVIADWPLADNHSYLWIYWCLAIALALQTRAPAQTLAGSARLLIGLVFFFASHWKGVLSEDFVDGRFFRLLFLTDERFEDLTLLFGGMTEVGLEQLRTLLERNVHRSVEVIPATLKTEAVRRLAQLATIGTLALEAGIALFFLLPRRAGVQLVGDLLLIGFCATTYVLAPVPGFGWLLLAMGVAQRSAERAAIGWLYLVTFLLMILHDHLPWLELLRTFTNNAG